MAGPAHAAAVAAWPPEKRWLFQYVVVVAMMAFCNRSLPTSFLPLVLATDFHQPFAMVGVAVAAYPAAALFASGWATRLAVASRRVIRTHSFSLLWMSAATALFALAKLSLPVLGQEPAMAVVIALRCFQGVTASMYLSSNTTLITRYFSDSVPYVLGMVEVGVGVGSQIGRLLGGFLYDGGGFWLPFVTLAVGQSLWALLGLQFDEMQGSAAATSITERKLTRVPYLSFLTVRGSIAVMAVLFNYFMVGFMDTTLPSHLEEHLGPIPIWVVSVLMAVRSATYLLVSYFCAQAMHRGWVSLEAMLAIGAGCCLGGMLLMGPIGPVQSMLASRDGWQPWTLQVLSFVVTSSGLAATFIPTLPLLQREVRHLGDQAVEQVAQLFIAAMSLGEAAGPILGGALTARVGFVRAAAVCAAPMALVLVGSLLWPGPAPAGVAGLDVPLDGPDPADEPYPLPVFLDGESAFRVRQMSFAFMQEVGPPGSAPSLTFRRHFSPKPKTRHRPWESAPSETFRRAYRS